MVGQVAFAEGYNKKSLSAVKAIRLKLIRDGAVGP